MGKLPNLKINKGKRLLGIAPISNVEFCLEIQKASNRIARASTTNHVYLQCDETKSQLLLAALQASKEDKGTK